MTRIAFSPAQRQARDGDPVVGQRGQMRNEAGRPDETPILELVVEDHDAHDVLVGGVEKAVRAVEEPGGEELSRTLALAARPSRGLAVRVEFLEQIVHHVQDVDVPRPVDREAGPLEEEIVVETADRKGFPEGKDGPGLGLERRAGGSGPGGQDRQRGRRERQLVKDHVRLPTQ